MRFVGVRLRDLLIRYETALRDERLQPIEWAEWSAFIDAAYSCGCVCGDGNERMGTDCGAVWGLGSDHVEY